MNVYMTRQPIFDRNGKVYAYELLYRDNREENEPNKASEDGSAEDLTDTFFGVDVKSITGDAKVFINFSDDLITQGVPRTFSPEILAVEVTEKQLADENISEAVRALKEQGYTIVLDGFEFSESNKDLLSLCDIVKLNIKASGKSLEEAAEMCRRTNKPMLMLAKNANTNADANLAKKLGCEFLQGYFYTRSAAVPGETVQPLPVNLIEVMQLMAEPDPEIDDIVDVMSRDAALCERILKLINSVYFGVSNKVSSINQAILILGLDYLREWVYLMGMQRISHNDSTEVMRLALIIAKFCRGLSGLVPEVAEKSDAVYLMGLLSMIVFSSERALVRALDEFPLTNEIKKGLLRCGGAYSDIFEMALSYVDGKWDEYEYIARKYGLSSNEVSDIFIKCAKEIAKLNMS